MHIVLSWADLLISFFLLGPIAGGVDEETFIRAFEDVPKIQLYSAKELEEHLSNIKTIIQDPANDWAKRAEAVIHITDFMISHNF